MKITFLGATQTVTGSKYLVETDTTRVLVDCGLFQGVKAMRRRNRQPPPVDPRTLDAVILTHAHIDHSGYLPVLVHEGFRKDIFCTPPTQALGEILLRDAGHLQEEDAEYAKRKAFSRHKNPKPLFTEKDAERVFQYFSPLHFNAEMQVGDLTFSFRPAGHILGAAGVEIQHGTKRIHFSGDVGRPQDLLMEPAQSPGRPDVVVMESTYGDKLHDDIDVLSALEEVVNSTHQRMGVLLIPAFAVGRTQSILLALHRLKAQNRIKNHPVYVNSPMATNVTRLYQEFSEYHRLGAAETEAMCSDVHFVRTVDESKALNKKTGPMTILSASGMLTGGRVLHHLKAFAPLESTTILMPGFQAAGTRGATLAGGSELVKVHGRYIPVKAEVKVLNAFSAHADQRELLDWLKGAEAKPKKVWLTHGEPAAADRMRLKIEEELGTEAEVAEHGQTAEI